MAIYHNNVNIVSRGEGSSAVGAAAYQSGTKLTNEWNGVTSDYRKKEGVMYTEIMLPDHAPREFYDRSTLWNSLELYEKRKDAQLARRFKVALPIELSLEEYKKIMHDYCQQFVDAGMCVDFAIHDPVTKDSPRNPHCHILLTMRPLDKNGKWTSKCRGEYVLDENGNRVRGAKGKWKMNKVSVNDWNEHSKIWEWRKSWADVVNQYLEANGRSERIDHRSNAERGLMEIPQIHVGVAATAMERKGIATDRGNINRAIKETNKMIHEIMRRLKELTEWIAALREAIQEETTPESSPDLGTVLLKYLEQESKRTEKYSGRFQVKHTAEISNELIEAVQNLREQNIVTVDDLSRALTDHKNNSDAAREKMKKLESKMKALGKAIDQAQKYQQTNEIHDKACSIKWKNKRAAFEEEHRAELTLWNAANRFLHANKIDPAELPAKLSAWNKELAKCSAEHDRYREKLKMEQTAVKQLWSLQQKVEAVTKTAEKKQERKQNMEH